MNLPLRICHLNQAQRFNFNLPTPIKSAIISRQADMLA